MREGVAVRGELAVRDLCPLYRDSMAKENKRVQHWHFRTHTQTLLETFLRYHRALGKVTSLTQKSSMKVNYSRLSIEVNRNFLRHHLSLRCIGLFYWFVSKVCSIQPYTSLPPLVFFTMSPHCNVPLHIIFASSSSSGLEQHDFLTLYSNLLQNLAAALQPSTL